MATAIILGFLVFSAIFKNVSGEAAIEVSQGIVEICVPFIIYDILFLIALFKRK